ncbi:polyprenyl synthetase family protein [Leifsonia sp. NCR5]|uniref:polyprenyl synthetase family protein n=1 Tax=Leifsonia sp. NCR5 TaxID=1978342 RepID=UPI000A190D9A|nr:polyprenyl synthetase family protein [Leifsonia sp. NCR5]
MTQIHQGAPRIGLPEVDARLAAFFTERSEQATRYGSEYQRLWSSARSASEGGKRIRPGFVLSAFDAIGGEASGVATAADAVDTAVAFELLHTAFLLHDDVIDGDTVRRGRPNVAGEFAGDAAARGIDGERAALWGETAAILAGDLLLHAAASLIARLDVPSPTRTALLDLLDHSIFVTAAGELSDVSYSLRLDEARLPDVLAMTERKTAAYSFAGPLAAGAMLAGAGGDVLAALGEYGRLLGIAFQLGDDLLGVFGEEDATGKSIVSDLREGKETSLIAYARATSAWPTIEQHFGRPDLDHDDGRRLAALLDACGSRAFVEGLVAEYADAAVAALAVPGLPLSLTDELSAVARSCVGRIA